MTWRQRRAKSLLQVESKIGLIRLLLAGRHESGQAFCKAAVSKLTESYLQDLRQLLGDVWVEVTSIISDDAFASVMDIEGPVVRWLRKEGVMQGAFLAMA